MPKPIALVYDDSAYQETLERPKQLRPEAPMGLMGRQVAGKAFLDAYLTYGTWDELVGLVRNAQSGASLRQFCEQHASSRQKARRLRLIEMGYLASKLRDAPASVLHFPSPPDPQFAWARQAAGQTQQYAFSGVTHTLCSARAIEALTSLVTAPFEPYDALVCTSRAVLDMVRAVTQAYADYLQQRHGGAPRCNARLVQIPLGVEVAQYRPATPAERQSRRHALHIAEDEIAVLFVGRLSHHAKAHPFPMFRAVAHAAQRTGKHIHLLLAGWAATDTTLAAFRHGFSQVCPNVRLHVLDGTQPDVRYRVWHAADVFMSLVDNIQETFGLVVIEAMAAGLPVIASDWNGYRDLVVHGETGFLIPTMMVRDATSQATMRLLTSEINYDQFLAECSQTVAVDAPAASDALARLIQEPELRQRLGSAGRERAIRHFSWQEVIGQYERLWRSQERRMSGQLRSAPAVPQRKELLLYPPLEVSFAGYPSRWLDGQIRLQAAEMQQDRLRELLQLPLTSHVPQQRATDERLLRELLVAAATPQSIAELDQQLGAAARQLTAQQRRATLAWLLKYDLLRVAEPLPLKSRDALDVGSATQLPTMCFITTCMGRLEMLQQSLPKMVAQRGCSCVVVDYSCPQRSGDWVREHYPQVRVVQVDGQQSYHMSKSRNAGAEAADAAWLCFIDADILLREDFAETVLPDLQANHYYRASLAGVGTSGTVICARSDFQRVGGYDECFQGWGEEDDDLCEALRFVGVTPQFFSSDLLEHIDHSEEQRVQHHVIKHRHRSQVINRLYRGAKWDMARLNSAIVSRERRQAIYDTISQQLSDAIDRGGETDVVIEMGQMLNLPLGRDCRRQLIYRYRS